jgi:aminoglycoside phosphotransferase (APT) family kinase protein
VLGQPYRIDSFVRGRELLSGLADAARRDVLVEAAAQAIGVLHGSTAATAVGDAGHAERWIDARLADLAAAGAGRDPRFAPRAALLRAELHDAVIGRTLTTSWIHGDYWVGNLLFSQDGAGVRGVVDWAAADPADLPLHDLLHLVMYTRRVVGGQGLGQIVRAQLRAPRLSALEQRLLERHVGWPPGGLPSYRDALLLYWLRHVAMHARQHGLSGDWRYRLWERRNVHAVLGAL